MVQPKRKIVFALACCLMLCSGMLYSQRQVSGLVTDADSGEPLIGANILVPGSTVGTTTDVNGTYSLQVPAGATQLEVTYTGYETMSVPIGTSGKLDIALKAGALLDEILVIGYGTVKREDLTGSVQAVTSKEFNKGAITSPAELLAGKVAGVQITTGGDPGGGSVIRIRGGSSLSANNDPLIVIDGVPVANDGISGSRNPLNIINPNDIETFTVLKDASATAIYGSRASNGVIIITTKKGKVGKKIGVEYNGNVAFSNIVQTAEVLNATEFAELVHSQYEEGHPAHDLLGSENTAWQSEIYQTAITHDHNINISGGVGSIPYRVSLGYTDRDGILKTDNFNRLTYAANLNPQFLNNSLQLNLGFKGTKDKNQFANRGAIGSSVFFDPTQPIYQDGNAFGGYFTYTDVNGNPNLLAPANPLALLNLTDDQSDVTRYIVNGSVDYRLPFVKGLRANLNLAYDKSKGEGTQFIPEYASFAFTDKGRKAVYSNDNTNSLLEYYMNYVKELGSTKLDLTGGYSWQHFERDDYSFATNVDGSKILNPEETFPKEYYLLSLFGRLNVTVMEDFLFTFTLRRDGTSRFSPDTRWGLFPAGAFAWKIVDGGKGTLSNLKLRLGYGVTGQQDIGGNYYHYLPRYLAGFENAQYQFGNDFVQTLRPEGYDANIKWEETTTLNAAIDYGFLDNRLYGSFEVYKRTTEDLINYIRVPAGTNLTNFLTTNVGTLENRGFEIGINAVPYERENSSWTLSFNATVNKNEITKLTASDDPNYLGVQTGGIAGGVGNTIQVHSVGYPANSFYVYEQVYDESGNPIEALYVDRNGDGRVTPADQYRYKKPAPDAFFGFSSAFNFGKFDISLAGRANVGSYIYNNNLSNNAVLGFLYQPTGYLGNTLSEAEAIDFHAPQQFSDYFVRNGSFLRFDHITAGYRFDLANNRSIYLRATMQNPILFTQYDGIDPEVFGGIDNNIYPRSRTFLLGVTANF